MNGTKQVVLLFQFHMSQHADLKYKLLRRSRSSFDSASHNSHSMYLYRRQHSKEKIENLLSYLPTKVNIFKNTKKSPFSTMENLTLHRKITTYSNPIGDLT